MQIARPTQPVRASRITAIFGLGLTAGLLGSACGGTSFSADAGADTEVKVGSQPVFDGCGSEGDIANYRWSIAEAPADMSDDVGKVLRDEATDCSFTLDAAMLADEAGMWVIELEVSDSGGSTSTDRVAVNVIP